MKPQLLRALGATFAFAGHARFTRALTLCVIAVAFLTHTINSMIGSPGVVAILIGLAILAGLSLIGRRETLEWRGVLPISLLAFLGWSAVSVFWSNYQWATLGSVAYQFVFAGLAIYVALVRDTIQIVRAFGDVLRMLLGLSLAVEVLSGLLIDLPIRFLGVVGNIAFLGPIQGLMGTRNQLGLVALLALVTFGTELVTRSVRRGVGIGSVIAAVFTLLLTQSPVSFGVTVILGLASVALLGLRRLSPDSRRIWQTAFAIVGAVALGCAYVFRGAILTLLDASNDFAVRVRLWRAVGDLLRLHPIEGWGWIGEWRTELTPFFAIDARGGNAHSSALNSYIDVWFQLGVVGLLAFLVLVILALGRSWILASQQRSRVFVWPALMLVTLLVTALAESSLLVDFGWLTLVICAVKAAENLSWRRSLPD